MAPSFVERQYAPFPRTCWSCGTTEQDFVSFGSHPEWEYNPEVSRLTRVAILVCVQCVRAVGVWPEVGLISEKDFKELQDQKDAVFNDCTASIDAFLARVTSVVNNGVELILSGYTKPVKDGDGDSSSGESSLLDEDLTGVDIPAKGVDPTIISKRPNLFSAD